MSETSYKVDGGDVEYNVIWQPHTGPQAELVRCPVHEICFGGARGGGKTDGAIGKWIAHANKYGENAHGVFFRKTFKQLEEVLKRTQQLFPKIGAEYNVSTSTWRFKNGATLKLRHLMDQRDAEEYQGHQYTFLVFEEATNWPTPAGIDAMRGTLRSGAGVPTFLILTANPGGAGHNWVKARYITPWPAGYKPIIDPETGQERVFIPSKLEDNPTLMHNDPTYEARLRRVSTNPALVKAWRWGDWDIVSGGFFDDLWRPDRHLLPQFKIPSTWGVVLSFDWGSTKPASLGVFARVGDCPPNLGIPKFFPRGSLIRIDEWYTVARDDYGGLKVNTGRRLSNEDLGAGIARRVKKYLAIKTSVADPSIFTEHGGPSIYDQMKRGAHEEGFKLIFNPADNNRITGWQRMRDMMEESAKETPERPGLWVMENCENWLRTVPVLQSDPSDPDDVDTDAEDHAADDTRYAVMAKPRIAKITKLTGY